MRIFKYFVLLFLLFSIGLTVFVATQKGDFDVTRSKLIKTPRATVYKFVNDYKNWETFSSWSSNENSMNFSYPEKTSGIGSSFSWKGKNNEGNIKTLFVKENDSISQIMFLDGINSKVYLTFKDTLGKTKISWRTIGKMNLFMKFYTFLNGGINNTFGDISEKSLANLDRTLDYELNTYNVKINGVVSRPNSLYIYKTINSYSNKVQKNTLLIIPKLLDFFKENNVVIHGKPFVLYNSYDENTDIVNYSICIPTRDSVDIKPKSFVSMSKLDSLSYVKTTLIGDYSHLKKAQEKMDEYIFKNKIKTNPKSGRIEVYAKTVKDVKNPSKWVTEIFIPIYKKPVLLKPRRYIRKDSIMSEPSSNIVTPIDN